MALNRTKISYLGKLPSRSREAVGLFIKAREMALKAALGFLLILAVAFIALPVASLFLKSPPAAIVQSMQDPVVIDALRLSLTTSTLTVLVVVLIGTPIAYVNARFHYPGKEIADSLIDLPVIMPPAVAGIALLMAFGRMAF